MNPHTPAEIELVAGNDKLRPWPKSLCRPSPDDECDCGYVGDWLARPLFAWHSAPGERRKDRDCRRDISRGLPPRANDEGWWVMACWEEHCPGCGDIEHRDLNGAIVFQQRNSEFPDARIYNIFGAGAGS